MRFRYVVYVPQTGKTQRGTLEAPSEAVAEKALWARDYVIITLEEVGARPPAAPAPAVTFSSLFPTFFGVKPGEITVFTRHLAALLGAGVSLLPALRVLHEQTRGPFRPVLEAIIRDIQRGEPLSGAVARQRRAFPSFYERMVRVGERAGNLDAVLRQVALYMEKEQAVQSRVRRALAYPSFVFLMGILVIVLLLTFALPALSALYSEFSADLPWPTRLLIAITTFIPNNALGIVLALALLAALAWLVVLSDEGQLAIDHAWLRLPLIGPVNVRSIVTRYCRTLSLLLRAGLPLVEIMELVESTVGNRIARRALAAVRREVIRGQSLSVALAAQPFFPPMLAQVVRVGEETGRLETGLEALADLFEEETDRAISAMTAAIEPALTIAVGLLVAFIALSTILPIYSILKHIR